MRRLVLSALSLVLVASCSSDRAPNAAGTPAPPATLAASAVPTERATPSGAARQGVLVTVGVSIDVLDPDTGRLLRTLQRTPEDAVDTRVKISDDGASTYVLREFGGFAACGRAQVLSVATAGGPVRPLVEEPTPISDFAVSPDRKTVAYERTDCGTGPNELVLLDLASGRERLLDRPDKGQGLAFSPDSTRLVAAGEIVDLSAQDPFTAGVPLEPEDAFDPRFRSSDGQLVVTLFAEDQAIVVALDVATGRQVGARRVITATAGSLVSDPEGVRYVGLDFPDEGDDYLSGTLVEIRGGQAVPLGDIQAIDVAWG